ncbi:SdpI family protein [Chitinophaga caseinilytica]|uniref:SdpI family protein n=1 Tax=Chitinophaga caseinilytica TaxID=2267521 RepID=UPI003C2B5B6D
MDSILQSPFCNASLLAGLLFLFMGYMIRRYPPRSMKTWYGYRTFSSTINQDTWNEGNRYAAYISRWFGWLLVPFGILMGLVFRRQSELFLYLTVTPVIVGALLLAGFTEWHLLQVFDEDGLPRNKNGGNQKPAV